MKNQKLEETDLYSLEFNTALSLVYLEFKIHASDGELQETIMLTLNVFRQYGLKYIMVNTQQLNYVDVNDQQWIATQFTRFVAALSDCKVDKGCKIIGILPSEATRLIAGYSVMEKSKEWQGKEPAVEIEIFTDVNTALLSLEPKL